MRIKVPDSKNSLSIIEAAKRDINFTLNLELTDDSGSTIVRNVYESFRMLGDALMISKGKVSIDHIEPIKELMNLHLETKRPLRLIDNLRRLRHNINYYGYRPRLSEVKESISLAKILFNPLYAKIKSDLNKDEPKIRK